jgi:unsaturated chondroitin disaccharide hydrolase
MNAAPWTDAIGRMLARIDQTGEQVKEGFPHFADTDTGMWTTSSRGDWTGGFWNGMCWLAHWSTKEERYLRWAHRWTELLRPRANSETVFRSFLFYYGAALASILLGDQLGRDLGIQGARGLASLYNPKARAIPLGTEAEEASDVGRTEANIDGVQGTALLIWAARETGDDYLETVGTNHALRHIEFCLRDDGSVVQSASFDDNTGEVRRRYTHKGVTDNSTWTRAQAWAMLGYSVNAIWKPDETAFLDTALRVSDWWIENLPEDGVAYWDFDAPREPGTKRDTSGTAIGTAALLKLSKLAPDDGRKASYRLAAEKSARALITRYLTPISEEDRRPPGILTQGCYNHRIGLATNNELIWGDYYLFESLQVLAGNLDPASI